MIPNAIISLLVCLFVAIQAKSQKPQVSSYPFYDHEGLLIKGTDIQQSSDNFLWSSHYNGLIKHAGKHKIFFPFDDPVLKNSDNLITLYDLNQNYLLGNNGKVIFSFNKNSGTYTTLYTNTNLKQTLFADFVKDFQGNLWATIGPKTLIKINKELNKVQSYDLTKFYKNLKTYNLCSIDTILKNGNIIIRIIDKSYLFDFETLTDISCNTIYSKNKIAYCYYISNGTFFPANESGTYQFENIDYTYTYVPELDAQQYQSPFLKNRVIRGRQGKNYIKSTNNRNYNENFFFLFSFNEDKEMRVEGYEFDGMVTNPIISEDEILVSSFNHINIINRNPQNFTTSSFLSQDNQLLNNVSCRSIATMDNGATYMLTTRKGIFKLEKQTQIFSEINLDIVSSKYQGTDYRELSLYGFEKLNDSVLIGYGYSEFLFPINIKTKEILPFPAFYSSDFPVTLISDISIKDSTSYYLGTHQGLYEYKVQEEKIYDRNQLNDSINLTGQYIESLYMDKKDNMLWIGLFNDGGLYKKNLSNDEVVHFNYQDIAYPIPDNNISVIEPDEDENIIWVGTKKGLQKINPQTNESQTFAFGEPSRNYITGIIQEQNTLWISTYNGLVRFNKNQGLEEVYTTENGLPDNEFNKKSFYKAGENKLFFGGINGVVSFDPVQYDYHKRTSQISMVTTSFYNAQLNKGQEITLGLEDLKEFIIPEEYNYLSIKLASKDFSLENKTRFQYRFKVKEQHWVEIDDTDELNLAGLSPGKHILEIRGINDFGVTSNYLQYKIKVTQKFYRNPWMVLILASTLLIFLSLYYRSRKNNIQQRYNALKNRSHELSAQMNPHYVYNILNSIQSTLLLEDPKEANRYMVLYASLVRKTLILNRKNFVKLKEIIEFLKSYVGLEHKRLDNNLDYVFNIDSQLNIETISIPTLFLQPVVENAIVHGLVPKKNDRKLWIRFFREEEHLIIEIEDNGVGRKKTMQKKIRSDLKRKSYGLEIMKERIKNINEMSKKTRITFEVIDLYDNDHPIGTKTIFKYRL